MMDLRLQLLSMRADYLNQLNTQATLVGGAAIGLLSSGELTVVNELSAQRIGNDEPATPTAPHRHGRELRLQRLRG